MDRLNERLFIGIMSDFGSIRIWIGSSHITSLVTGLVYKVADGTKSSVLNKHIHVPKMGWKRERTLTPTHKIIIRTFRVSNGNRKVL